MTFTIIGLHYIIGWGQSCRTLPFHCCSRRCFIQSLTLEDSTVRLQPLNFILSRQIGLLGKTASTDCNKPRKRQICLNGGRQGTFSRTPLHHLKFGASKGKRPHEHSKLFNLSRLPFVTYHGRMAFTHTKAQKILLLQTKYLL